MARRDEDRELVYYIPQNFRENNVTSSGLPWRNIIESGILAAVLGLIIFSIPIPMTPKVVVGTIFVGGSFFATIKGFKGYSMTEFIINAIKFKLKPKNYIRKTPFEDNDKTH